MSPLAALVHAYDRMAAHGKMPLYGYSQQKIGFIVPLNPDGTVAHKPIDIRQGEGKKKTSPLMAVPQTERTSGIKPNFLWDKTAYSLGVAARRDKLTLKKQQKHEEFVAAQHRAFVVAHQGWLASSPDAGLQAILRFLNNWSADQFGQLGWPEDMKDQNIVFALESERLESIMIHNRPAARELWTRLIAAGEKTSAPCLITGDRAPPARVHHLIKGVWGAQSSGARIVSFNLDASESYGHKKGDNAPVSESAAFAYTSALNHFLERDSGHRIQVGDASTVFWADSSSAQAALEAESLFLGLIDGKDAESVEERKIGATLGKLRTGRPIAEFKLDLPQGVRFFIMALAPNVSRLWVRFYIEDDFGVIAERYQRHFERLRIIPPPKDEAPSMWQMLIETAARGKSDNIQPNLAGEWMRAILADSPYPLTLLSILIVRLRADHRVNALRVAILKSILIKNFKMEVPVSFNPGCKEPGYLLGRLFAVYEQIQTAALGRNINATIKDKFYGSAAAQPRKIFRMLDSGSANHLSKIGKQRPGHKVNLEKAVGAIMEAMSPDHDPFPASLPEKSQALFALGYYHQRNEFFKKSDKSTSEEAA